MPHSIAQKLSAALELHRLGKLKRAEAAYRKILNKQPNNGEALQFLGVLLHQTGREVLAEQFIQRAIKLDKTNAGCYFNLAEVQRASDRPQAAISNYRKAIELESDQADYYFGLGSALLDTGDSKTASELLQQAVLLAPDDAQIHNNLGNALADIGQIGEAIISYRSAISAQADYTDSYYNLARLYRDIGDFLSAVNCYQALLEIDPLQAKVCALLADCLAKLDRYEEAIEQINKALEVEADNAEAFFNLGICLQALGRFDEATESHRKALSLKPDLGEAAYNLVLIDSKAVSDEELNRFASRSCDDGVEGNVRINLHFALAKAYHDRSQYKDAFEQLKSGNDLKAGLTPFDPVVYENYIERIVANHDEQFFEARSHFGLDSKVPVFIVGMPRSGSTLVEQIISSHPLVHGAGELNDMRILGKRLPEVLGSESEVPEILTEISEKIAESLAIEHLHKLNELSNGAERVCDKMLGNFLKLGLIFMMFPRARVIHCMRNPLDTGLSCYFQNFARGLRFTYQLEHLGLAYQGYLRVMAHWRKILPLPMMEVRYEHLISDQEQVSRELIDFCDLDWDQRCLAFHQQQRGVKTASFWQVRQPVYSSSVGRWRQYQKQLQPLIDILGSSVDEYENPIS